MYRDLPSAARETGDSGSFPDRGHCLVPSVGAGPGSGGIGVTRVPAPARAAAPPPEVTRCGSAELVSADSIHHQLSAGARQIHIYI